MAFSTALAPDNTRLATGKGHGSAWRPSLALETVHADIARERPIMNLRLPPKVAMRSAERSPKAVRRSRSVPFSEVAASADGGVSFRLGLSSARLSRPPSEPLPSFAFETGSGLERVSDTVRALRPSAASRPPAHVSETKNAVTA